MKFKITVLLCCCLILAALSVSCGKEKPPLAIDLAELMAEINAFIPADSLYGLSDDYLEEVYGFELVKMTQYAAYKDVDMNSANEVLLFETDAEYAEKVYELIGKIQSRLIIEIENYTNNPSGMDQYSKARSAVIIQEQGYVFFIVSESNDEIRAVIERLIA